MEGEVFYENFCYYKVILYLVNADVYTKPIIERTMALKEPGRLALSHSFEKGNGDDQVILFPILSLSPPLIPIPIPYFFDIACSSPLVSTELASGEI